MSLEIKNRAITEGSIVDLLDRSAQKSEGSLKLWSAKNPLQNLSYGQIKEATLGVAAYFESQGIRPGDRVILWGQNCPEWVIAHFAALRMGGITVPFDVRAKSDFLGRVIEATKPRSIIAGASQIKELPADCGIPVIAMERISTLTTEPATYPLNFRAKADDPAEIVFTSGTTGNPKGAVLTHQNILANIEAIQKVVRIKPEDKLLSILPLSHMFEMTAGLLVPVAEGAGVVYTDTLTPATLLRAIHDEQITCMATVPQVLQLFKRSIEQEVAKQGKQSQWDFFNRISRHLPLSMRRILFSSLHRKMGGHFDFFVCGGAPLDPSLAASWENVGIKVVQGYGMTEASPVVTCDSISDRNHHYVGRPLPGVEVKIADDGEILVKGPNIMSGYWNNPSATAEVLDKDRWYYTGDLGSLENNRLKLHGRKKDMIVLPDGSNVYPEDVESVLKQYVRDAVVFGKEIKGRVVIHSVLLLENPDEKQIDIKALIRAANARLAPNQQIQDWSIWPGEDFPRTPTLKVKRFEIIW
ncbi:AMP-binding protein [Candidatus Daviesbacteria bacterium]|nr:AMP-binding protein [Candidatus Daviesbacteria bacterium]